MEAIYDDETDYFGLEPMSFEEELTGTEEKLQIRDCKKSMITYCERIGQINCSLKDRIKHMLELDDFHYAMKVNEMCTLLNEVYEAIQKVSRFSVYN